MQKAFLQKSAGYFTKLFAVLFRRTGLAFGAGSSSFFAAGRSLFSRSFAA